MSAIPAKVFSGLIRAMMPAITNRTPKMAHSHFNVGATAATTNCWKPESRNMSPIRTPTVVTEAASNCSTTSAIRIQAMPVTSQSHHSLPTLMLAQRLRLIADELSTTSS